MAVFIITVASGERFPVYGESFADAERAAKFLSKEPVVSITKATSTEELTTVRVVCNNATSS